MTPSPARSPVRHRTVHGSALAQITSAVISTLHIHNIGSRPHKTAKGAAKVYVDSRSLPSRRSLYRTAGRNGDNDIDVDAYGGDPVWAKKISMHEGSRGRATDAVAVDHLASTATTDSAMQAAPPGLTRRPTMLGSTPSDSLSGSLRNLKAKLFGDATAEHDVAHKREAMQDVQYDEAKSRHHSAHDAVDNGLYEGGEFDDEDLEDDPQMRRLRALAAAEQDELAYFSNRGASFDFKIGRRWVFHPHGRLRSAWDCFLLGLITWMLVTTPFELSFRELSHSARRAILMLDGFLDMMFAVDIILNFMTAIESDGRLHFSYASIRRHYLSGWFWMDALWTFPFYALTNSTGADVPDFMSIRDLFQSDLYPLLRIFRLARIVSLARIRRRLEFSLRISSSSSSLGGFVFSVLALSHLFSCMFAYLAFGDDYHLHLALTDHVLEDDSIYSKYIASSYWAMMTIATVGYGDLTVKTNAGRLFAIVAMVMGGGIFAYGISNVVDLFQQLYVEEATYRHKMDQVNTFMHARALPRKLRDDIRADFFHLRKATREHKADDFAIVRQMSRTMQSHVADLFCLAMMPTRMPTLAGCSAEFIHELYLTMEVQCYLPGEHIIRQDEFGSELFFLFVGYVQAIVGHTKVALFGPNTCFGEFAIMNPKRPRLATIQAVDFCETHCVTRAQLLAIVLRHPFVLRSIREIVDLRHRKALTVLTDPTAKTRTLIQSLAGVWHTDGLQALMPPGVHAEDVPELHTFMATPSAGERSMTPLSRLASVRLGSPSPARRKSVSTADAGNPAEAATAGATTAQSLPRRHSSIRMAEPVSGSFESVETCNTARDGSAKARRMASRPGDGESSVRNAAASSSNGGGDDRVGLVLHQMNLLLKRQEKLESQLQQLLETRGVVSSPPASAMADSTNSIDLLRRRKGASVTDLANTIH